MNSSFGQSWTTYYRPQRVEQLNQVPVRTQIEQCMKSGYFPRVLLLAGPKGTGKTTSARLIGAIVNEEANREQIVSTYLHPTSSKNKKAKSLKNPDATQPLIKRILQGTSYVVQELDAASNRGIQEVRNLQDRSMLAPVEGVLSVYILDEVHMLTAPAFNALLKLLEEPPAHAMFILATTELHKLPDTVRSRCQIISFRKSTEEEVVAALTSIAESEKLTIDDEALQLLASLAEGSFRDAVKYLQLLSQSSPITTDLIKSVIQASYLQQVEQLVQLVLQKDAQGVTNLFQSLRIDAVHPDHYVKQLLSYIHQKMLTAIQSPASAAFSTAIAVFLLKEFSKPEVLQTTPIPLLGLEIACLDMILRSKQKNGTSKRITTIHKQEPTSDTHVTEASGLRPASVTDPNIVDSHTNRDDSLQSEQSPTTGDATQLLNRWQEFTSALATKNATLAALFRSAQPREANQDTIVLHVYYRFHQEQLSHPKSLRLIEEVMQTICNGQVKLDVILQTAPAQEAELIETNQLAPDTVFANQVVSALR